MPEYTLAYEGATVLNIYLAPKSGKSPRPADAAVDAAVTYLEQRGVLGPLFDTLEYAAGPLASRIFHSDANQHLCPAEQTFESFSIHTSKKVRFLPRAQDIHEFHSVVCPVCHDPMDVVSFQDALQRLEFFPIETVNYECPSCCTEQSFRDLNFGQVVGWARFWFLFEGAAFRRLNTQMIHGLSRVLGMPLIIVPEVIDDEAEAWGQAPHIRFRR
jgi:hypothetical protein